MSSHLSENSSILFSQHSLMVQSKKRPAYEYLSESDSFETFNLCDMCKNYLNLIAKECH
ncbi:21165_t:CDS:1, partial [Dentiscutata erythropus]